MVNNKYIGVYAGTNDSIAKVTVSLRISSCVICLD